MYYLFRAARYLGVPPWELEKQSVKWRNWALLIDGCELEAKAYHDEAARRAAGG